MKRASLRAIPAEIWRGGSAAASRALIAEARPTADDPFAFQIEADEILPPNAWSLLVKRRDGYICHDCRQPYPLTQLHAHHVDRDRTNNRLSNGRTLCVPCHNATHAAIRAGTARDGGKPQVAPSTYAGAVTERCCTACAYCGTSLEGRRKDARYCCDVHRALASKERTRSRAAFQPANGRND